MIKTHKNYFLRRFFFFPMSRAEQPAFPDSVTGKVWETPQNLSHSHKTRTHPVAPIHTCTTGIFWQRFCGHRSTQVLFQRAVPIQRFSLTSSPGFHVLVCLFLMLSPALVVRPFPDATGELCPLLPCRRSPGCRASLSCCSHAAFLPLPIPFHSRAALFSLCHRLPSWSPVPPSLWLGLWERRGLLHWCCGQGTQTSHVHMPTSCPPSCAHLSNADTPQQLRLPKEVLDQCRLQTPSPPRMQFY